MVQHSAFAAIVLTAVFLCLNQVTETDNSEISLPQVNLTFVFSSQAEKWLAWRGTLPNEAAI